MQNVLPEDADLLHSRLTARDFVLSLCDTSVKATSVLDFAV